MKRAFSLFQTIRQHRRQTPPGLPSFLTYLVTFSCNARCVMCDSWRKPSTEDLTLPDIEHIFRQLPQMDMVRLSGGEPFLRKDLSEIAQLIQDLLHPMALHITTNGFLTDRILEFCEARDTRIPLYLLISLDGMQEKHNQIRGRKTAWEQATQTLRALAPRQTALRVQLAVNQTIVDTEGIEQYSQLREFLAPFAISHNVVIAYHVSATYHQQHTMNAAPTEIGQFTTFGEFSPSQLKTFFDDVKRDLAGQPFMNRIAKRYYLQGVRNRLLKQQGSPNPACVALTSHLRLFPNGIVPTCQFNTVPVGNLRYQSFEEIWHSSAIRTQRNWVARCPGCWAECEVLPNAVYTGDLFAHLFRFQR